MAQLDLKNTTTPITPSSGYNAFYWDANGTPKYRDSSGIDHSMGGLSTWFDVTSYGLKGDDSTDNLAAIIALMTLAPLESTLFFPAGSYRFSGEIPINFDKRFRFLGCGRGRSILKTTSATAHLFNISVAGYYASFEELGFTSTATRTAGAYIIASNSNAYLNVTGCEMQSYFIGVQLTGSIAANLGTIDNCQFTAPATNGQGVVINGASINMTIQNSTLNHVPNASGTGQCVEINQCGSIQIVNCDIIGGVNALRVNATAIVAAIYVTNTFFDQSGGSTVKIAGGFSSSRIKFVQCGIAAGTASTHAIEINGTGAGAVGTSTALPAGLDFVECDIYYAPGSSSGNGFQVNGVQDFSVQSCRMTGFSNGINVATGTAGTKFSILDNTFGPNSNLTVTNATDITVANSGTYGSYQIRRNVLGGTIKLADAGVLAAGAQKSIADNLGLASGTSSVGADQAIAVVTETVVTGLSLNIPANGLRVGTLVRFYVDVVSTNANAITPRVRCGPTGAITETIVVNTVPTTVTPVANQVIRIWGTWAVKTTGATGTGRGQLQAHVGGTTAPVMTTSAASAATLNTTVSNIAVITLAQITAGAWTVIGGAVEVVQQ